MRGDDTAPRRVACQETGFGENGKSANKITALTFEGEEGR